MCEGRRHVWLYMARARPLCNETGNACTFGNDVLGYLLHVHRFGPCADLVFVHTGPTWNTKKHFWDTWDTHKLGIVMGSTQTWGGALSRPASNRRAPLQQHQRCTTHLTVDVRRRLIQIKIGKHMGFQFGIQGIHDFDPGDTLTSN